jgi:glycogen debranching enzyme
VILEFEADFADLFEVRGLQRKDRGRTFPPETQGSMLVFSYKGLDGRLRQTRIVFDMPPMQLVGSQAHYHVRLEPGADATYRFAIRCAPDVPSGGSPHAAKQTGGAVRVLTYEQAAERGVAELKSARADEPEVCTSNQQFNDWLNRSIADLHMMRTETIHGPYPYAGVPWFSTAFGRDGIITALECLWFNPRIARGVLAYLAATQAGQDNAERDAQPGKILHEMRGGEMAALGEVPFGRYYGSIDATPLFVVLAGAYYERTGDLSFIRSIWPHVKGALAWIDQFGDTDGDGFVEYMRRSTRGLVQQGWKDSQDSVFHADGKLADGPIALCEVQGYVYAAKIAASELAGRFGDHTLAEELASQAQGLRRRFEETYWCEAISTYALALDGKKQLCAVRTSNPGHCLYTGIVSEDRARRVMETLTGEASFSGWGVRTLSANEARYNPMSYHNGSVWPHDNALIAAGFGRYGLRNGTAKIFAGLLDASLFFDLHRLPELFCGFHRRPGESPTLYPVSCSPQTWASGAVFLCLQACLGLEVLGSQGKVVFSNPYLPQFLPEVRITGLRVGQARLDLSLTRHECDVGINVLRREGDVGVVVVK